MKTNHNLFLILSVLMAVMLVSCASANERAGTSPAPTIAPVATPDLANATVNAAFGVPGDGNVMALGLMDTCRYLIQVAQGAPNTFIMLGPNGEYFLAWSMQDNTWGFLALTANGAPWANLAKMINGNYANTLSFSDLVKGLEQNGWQYVTPAALPVWLASTLGTASAFVLRYGDLLASPIPMIIILPGGDFVNPTNAGQD